MLAKPVLLGARILMVEISSEIKYFSMKKKE